MSAIERSDSDSEPRLCATAIFSAMLRSDLERDVGEGLDLRLAVVVLLGDALVGGEHAQVADDRLGDLERRAFAATLDRLGQNHVDMVAREDEAGDARRHVHRNRDGAHAGAERRGEEAAVLRTDERTASDRLAGGDLIANHGAEQLLGIAVRLALDVIGALHELLRPGLEGEAVGIDDRADRQRLLGDEHLRPERNGWSAAACCAPAPANIFLAMTAVTTAMTSAPTSSASFFTSMARSPPPNGPLEQPHKSDKLVKKPLGENSRDAPKAIATPYGISRTALAALGAMPAENAQGQHAAGERHQHEKFHRRRRREPQARAAASLTSPPPIIPA